jgi:hypothetical protein
MPSSFFVSLLFEGLIWFLLPTALVIVNDIMAYLAGERQLPRSCHVAAGQKVAARNSGGGGAVAAWYSRPGWCCRRRPDGRPWGCRAGAVGLHATQRLPSAAAHAVTCMRAAPPPAGFFFGRTPLIKLSPKKTWEGFLGGCVGTGAAVLARTGAGAAVQLLQHARTHAWALTYSAQPAQHSGAWLRRDRLRCCYPTNPHSRGCLVRRTADEPVQVVHLPPNGALPQPHIHTFPHFY